MSPIQPEDKIVSRDQTLNYLSLRLGRPPSLDFVTLVKWIKIYHRQNKVVWITGLSGSGKSYLYAKMRKLFKNSIYDLEMDMFYDANGDSRIKPNLAAAKYKLLFGTCDQRWELLDNISEFAMSQVRDMKIIIIHVVPSYGLFRAVNQLRPDESRRAGYQEQPTYERWLAWANKNAQMTPKEYLEFMADDLKTSFDNFRKWCLTTRFRDMEQFLFFNQSEDLVLQGYHENRTPNK